MSYHLTSTMIDDEELIEELKKYDDHIVTNSSQGSKKKGAAASNGPLLSDKNREIYLKKLNHYKAREKAESNPSKQYLKQKQQQQQLQETTTAGASASGGKGTPQKSSKEPATRSRRHEETNGQNETSATGVNNDDDDDDDDVIDITDSKQDGSGYYVQMANAQTSPLSNTTYFHQNQSNGIDDQPDVIYTSSVSPPPSQPLKELNYVSLKDKIELEKTLSKYRSDIHNILNKSKAANRVGTSPSSANRYQNDENSEPRTTGADFYCPKPAKTSSKHNRSILDVFKPSTYLGGYNSKREDTDSSEVSSAYSHLREVRGGANWRGLNGNSSSTSTRNAKSASPSKDDYLIPVKESPSALSSFYHDQLKPFVTNFGLQISKFLPYLVIIIFTIIILQYVRMKFQTMPGDGSDAGTSGDSLYSGGESWFSSKSETNLPNQYCPDIKDIKCSQTKVVLRELIDYLRSRSGVVDCTVANSDRLASASSEGRLSVNFIEKCIHLNEIVDFLMNKRSLISKKYQNEAVDSVLKAVIRNPHWDIHLLNETYAETSNPSDVVYMMSSVSSKPVMCRLREGLQILYIRGLMIASAVVVIALSYLAITLYNRQRNEKNQIFYNLVSQVVAMVEKQYELSLRDPSGLIKPYVAISHIYDTLVEPSQRAHQKALWNKVIKFIADHESRIHLETQFIDGEETHVWKWIVAKHDATMTHSFKYMGGKQGIGLANSTMINGDSTPFHHGQMHDENNETNAQVTTPNIYPALPQATANGWQGDAFSKSDRTIFSPTPCLKIRNMFDQMQIEQDPYFSQKIHNAILEKCSIMTYQNQQPVNTTILHIACDRKSKEGCVYVKCISNEAAGRAYQALNGTWYNGKLLNVKYLRSDRYLERFPESIAFNQPLQRINI